MSGTTEIRSERKVLEGVVLSDKMDKTRVVVVERRLRHRQYGKVLLRSLKIYAHDDNNECHTGDRVRVMETRPTSKLKRWRLVSVIKKADGTQGAEIPTEGQP